jgi:hypothetical protein
MRVTPADRALGRMTGAATNGSGAGVTSFGSFSGFSASSGAEPKSELQKTLVKSAKDVFAGTCGGITVTLLGHPFDTVKVRQPAPRKHTRKHTRCIHPGSSRFP